MEDRLLPHRRHRKKVPKLGPKAYLNAAGFLRISGGKNPLDATSEKKISGLGEIFVPTGDVDADIAAIKAFYAPFKGKNASQYHAD